MFRFIFIFLLSTALFAEKNSDLTIRGIVIVGDLDFDKNSYEETKGIWIDRLDGFDFLKQELQEKYLDQALTVRNVQEIKECILRSCQSQGRLMVAVEIPEQNVSSGVVVFVLLEAKAGRISFHGNRWFSDRNLAGTLKIAPGDKIDQKTLLNKTAWLNRNSFRSAEVILSPGEKPGLTDLEFSIKDRFPVRTYAGADNTGTRYTGMNRIFTGFAWGNAWGIGDLLSFQLTASPDFYRFLSYFLTYSSFLPWMHEISFFGGYASIHPKVDGFKNDHGRSGQGSFRYTIPFKPLYASFLQELVWGFDYKFLNNDLFFLESKTALPDFVQSTNLTQFYGSYALKFHHERHRLLFKIECYSSLFKWLPHQNNSSYHVLRPGATPIYLYSKMAAADLYTVARRFAISGFLRAQISTNPLLPSEQFGLGGYDTVRGYNERAYNADNAVCVNLEIHSPHFTVFKSLSDSLYFLAFLDYGWGRCGQAKGALPTAAWLAGTGPGVRYQISSYLTARLDYAWQLHSIFDDTHFGKFHFSVIGGY